MSPAADPASAYTVWIERLLRVVEERGVEEVGRELGVTSYVVDKFARRHWLPGWETARAAEPLTRVPADTLFDALYLV